MAKARVLVVDDDPAIRRILSQTLELEDYSVDLASDGEQALEAVRSERPDLLILDVMMPNKDGFEVLKELRADEKTSDLPVILLTAKSTQDDVWEGWNKGVNYYVSKPFDIEELLRFMDYVLSDEYKRDSLAPEPD